VVTSQPRGRDATHVAEDDAVFPGVGAGPCGAPQTGGRWTSGSLLLCGPAGRDAGSRGMEPPSRPCQHGAPRVRQRGNPHCEVSSLWSTTGLSCCVGPPAGTPALEEWCRRPVPVNTALRAFGSAAVPTARSHRFGAQRLPLVVWARRQGLRLSRARRPAVASLTTRRSARSAAQQSPLRGLIALAHSGLSLAVWARRQRRRVSRGGAG